MRSQRNGNAAAAGLLASGLTFGLLGAALAAPTEETPTIPPTNIVVRTTDGRLYNSVTGLDWEQVAETSPPIGDCAITFGAGRFVTIGSFVLLSSNGRTWEQRAELPGVNCARGIAYGNGSFVAVMGNQISWRSNDDGLSWERGNSPPNSTRQFISVAYGNGRFVAITTEGMAHSHDNGKNWINVPPSRLMHAIAYGERYFVAVGLGAMASPNGETWFTSSSNTTNMLKGVVYEPISRRFVAVGGKGTILASEDLGTTWTPVNSGTTADLSDIALGNGFLVAVGGSTSLGRTMMGYVAFSMDGGDTWRQVRSSIPGGVDSVAVAF